MRKLVALVFLIMSTSFSVQATERIPVEEFLKRDTFETMRISPDGNFIAATVPMEDRTRLVILNRSDLKQTGFVTPPKNVHVTSFYWVNPTRILFSVSKKEGELNQPRSTGEIYGVNADGTDQKVLAGSGAQSFTASRIGSASNLVAADILDTLRDDDENVIVAIYGFGNAFTEVHEMNAYSGRRKVLAKAPVRNANFTTDKFGVARFAVGAGNDNLSKAYYRKDAKSEWVLINDEAQSDIAVSVRGFNEDNTTAYLEKEEKSGPNAIYKFDLATQAQTLLYKDEDGDPGMLLYSPGDRSLYGINFIDGYPRVEYLDSNNPYAKIQKTISRSFPEAAVSPLSYTKDGNLGLYVVYSEKQAGDFYLFDKSMNKLSYLAGRSAWIKPETMSSMEPIQIVTRDRMKMIAYLTTPKGSSGKNLPLIIYPHGGPFGVVDVWGYDPEVQMLANRGYAVLQVNFRGSGNYGRSFRTAGYKQWGGTMQDDLTDATQWAIKSGVADPNRVCIYGASYGGYAALMGVAKEPDLYRCAIGNVGVYDMKMMYGRGDVQQSDSGENFLNDTLGSSDLDKISPNKLATRIKVPVLLLAGREDVRAPPQHTEVMYRSLNSLGKPVEMKIYDGEGHGNYLEANRIDFANRILAFFDKHIGPSSQKARSN
jgi:dipeptidyl aminopeptidase/acylaminoacyl peptidase